ncbi:MAG TPA: transcription antitermination factor NusB [Rhizomicrobium sp.]|jgi:N utilization substance protein B|nr:transcription antitermination factor NusB [Rhizomicrobium sp.]
MAQLANAGRHAARLAAVQAIYQMELTGDDAETVAQEFCEHRFNKIEHEQGEPDELFFSDLVRGVPHHQVEIDRAIADGLSENWKLQRIDSILRAILRAGIYELVARKDVPTKVVIDEYLDIAHAFFGGDEPAFVNALLDRVARRKRAVEFGEAPPDDELRF